MPARTDAPDTLAVPGNGLVYLGYGQANSGVTTELDAYDGRGWSRLLPDLLKRVAVWSIGFDPAKPVDGLFAGVTEDPTQGPLLLLADSHDGFRSVDNVRTVLLPNPQQAFGCGATQEPYPCRVHVMPDASGQFYIDARAGTPDTSSSKHLLPYSFLAVRPPLAMLPAVMTAAQAAAGGGAPGQSSSPQGSGDVRAPLNTSCQLPNYANGMASGTLAYDGQSLLYTDTGDDVTDANTAVIRKFDPATCAPTGVILVQFDPNDVQALDPDPTYKVEVGIMTYDARRQVLWIQLRDPGRGDPHGLSTVAMAPGLFTVQVTDPAPAPVEHAIARLVIHNGCLSYTNTGAPGASESLAYDFASDTLITCDQSSTGTNGIRKLSAADGSRVASCLDTGSDWFSPYLTGWTVTRPGQVYGEWEDDKTMWAVEVPEDDPSRPCGFPVAYTHPSDGEPLAEDEELACDSQTFSTTGRTQTVVWIRNTGHTAFSYAVPGGRCPIATFTHYLSPAVTSVGSTTSLCASVTVHYLEGYKVLPAGLPIHFSVGSRELGVGYTTGATDVCTPPLANPLPVGAFVVTASFEGTDAYLASSGKGTLDVVGAVLATGGSSHNPLLALPPAAGPGGPLPPAGVAQPAPIPQLQSAGQVQVEAQSQAQSQVQGVTQAQPGVMVQRQKRTQVALQKQEAAPVQTSYKASRIRSLRQAPVPAIALSAMLLGLGVAARRPRWAVALGRIRRRE